MEETINQRLNFVVDTFEGGTKASFARKVGISPQGAQELLSGRKGAPSFKVLLQILESYPQVRMEWLIKGEGPRFEKDVPFEPRWVEQERLPHHAETTAGKPLYHSYIGNYPVKFPESHSVVPIVTGEKRINYFGRYKPPTLPDLAPHFEAAAYDSISIPTSLIGDVRCIAFPVVDDSMEPSLIEGDFVICAFFEPSKWIGINSAQLYVVFTKKQAMFICRLSYDVMRAELRCEFDNMQFASVDLQAVDIDEIWEFKLRLSSDINKGAGKYLNQNIIYKLQNDMKELQGKVDSTISIFNKGSKIVIIDYDEVKSRLNSVNSDDNSGEKLE